jgi:hypothetical protein
MLTDISHICFTAPLDFSTLACAIARSPDLTGSGPAAALRPATYAQRSKQKGSLRLFLDSADISLWEKYQNGSLYGESAARVARLLLMCDVHPQHAVVLVMAMYGGTAAGYCEAISPISW